MGASGSPVAGPSTPGEDPDPGKCGRWNPTLGEARGLPAWSRWKRRRRRPAPALDSSARLTDRRKPSGQRRSRQTRGCDTRWLSFRMRAGTACSLFPRPDVVGDEFGRADHDAASIGCQRARLFRCLAPSEQSPRLSIGQVELAQLGHRGGLALGLLHGSRVGALCHAPKQVLGFLVLLWLGPMPGSR
jgi:hypothetical protein